jgi:2,5-furandicarboxylate decarboxylase 1
MSAPDLRTFLEDLRDNLSVDILNIQEQVPLDYTSTALALALEKQGRYPVLLFDHLQGYPGQLVANLFASRRVMSRSLGVDEEAFNARLGECLDQLIPVQRVTDGPVHEITLVGEQADLARLPVPRHFAHDAGPYITAGMVAARDPDSGVNNLSYARLQVKEGRKLGASLHSRQHLWEYQRRAELTGKDLPVAVVIGAHPAVMVAAAAKMGIDQDEYELAGALLGQPLPVCRAKTVDVEVPANAEIVIEGHILANAREPEGPFGEYTGYMTGRSTNNVMTVSAITLRRDAIFVDIVPGNSAEHLTLGRASKEAWVFKRMKEALPFVMDFYYPSSGTHFHCYLRIDKTAEGQAAEAAALLMGLDHYVKLVVVVDRDIDPRREADVWWAVATRMQADRDLNILRNVMVNRLDPSSADGLGAKLILDATAPLDGQARRISLPTEAEELARRLLNQAS